MGILGAYTSHCVYFLGYCILSHRAKFTWKQNVATLSLGLIYAGTVTTINRLGSTELRNGLMILFFAVLARLYWLLGQRRRNEKVRSSTDKCSLGVFMGSGGHSAEMKALVSSLDFNRYTPRTYVHCHGDEMSLRIISELESTNPDHQLLGLPRARRVGEGRISTLFSATKTLFSALWYTFFLPMTREPLAPWVDVLILNGPGTAVILVAVSWIRRFVGLPYTKVIYVESFARTNSLSLSGKILRDLVDVFVVQWPETAGAGSTISINDRKIPGADRDNKVTHRGWLV